MNLNRPVFAAYVEQEKPVTSRNWILKGGTAPMANAARRKTRMDKISSGGKRGRRIKSLQTGNMKAKLGKGLADQERNHQEEWMCQT